MFLRNITSRFSLKSAKSAESQYISTVLSEIDDKLNAHFPYIVFTIPRAYDLSHVLCAMRNHLVQRLKNQDPPIHRHSNSQHIVIDMTDNFPNIPSYVEMHVLDLLKDHREWLSGTYVLKCPARFDCTDFAKALEEKLLMHGKKSEWIVSERCIVLMSLF